MKHFIRNTNVRKPVGNNIIYLSGRRQKSYLAAARRVIWRPPEEINYLAAARRVIWRPPEEINYLAAARRIIWRPPNNSSGGRQINILYYIAFVSPTGFRTNETARIRKEIRYPFYNETFEMRNETCYPGFNENDSSEMNHVIRVSMKTIGSKWNKLSGL